MAILTGGQVISKDKGHKLEKINGDALTNMLGRSRMVTVTKTDTTIVDGKGTEEDITKRAGEIKEQIEKATSFYEKEKLQERLGKLIGGVAIINVGGNSDIEIKEKKDRLEDSLLATKAALAEGVVAGGGMALFTASEKVEVTTENANEKLGEDIVKAACKEPFMKILSNVGIDNWYAISYEIDELSSELALPTFDAKNLKVVDAFDAGILDPTKVVITAIKNSSSVAGTILTTESVVYLEKEKGDSNNMMDPMMGMGM
jgi:chaperonin GroEL